MWVKAAGTWINLDNVQSVVLGTDKITFYFEYPHGKSNLIELMKKQHLNDKEFEELTKNIEEKISP